MLRSMLLSVLACALTLSGQVAVNAGESTALPPPAEAFGADVATALQARRATREFSDKAVDLQTLSNLLWAADGINRADSRKRTAPFAMGIHPIVIYALTADGASRYDVEAHALVKVSDKDLRAQSGTQPFVRNAQVPVVFVFTYDSARGMPRADARANELFAWNGLGAIQQNLALACAAMKMGGVVVASIDKDMLKAELQLVDTETPLTIQPVGYLK